MTTNTLYHILSRVTDEELQTALEQVRTAGHLLTPSPVDWQVVVEALRELLRVRKLAKEVFCEPHPMARRAASLRLVHTLAGRDKPGASQRVTE